MTLQRDGAPAFEAPMEIVASTPRTHAAHVSEDPLRAIDWGTKLSTASVDVYFAPRGQNLDGGASLGWLPFEKRQVMLALSQIEGIANVTFRETDTRKGAEFRLATTNFDDPYLISFMMPPLEEYAGLGVFDVDFLSLRDPYSGGSLLRPGGFMFSGLLHEFGHGLGLAHPHDNGGTSTILKGVTSPWDSYGVGDLNQGVYTTMTYNHGWPGGPSASAYLELRDYGYEASMMAIDVAVLQRKYGANMSHAMGDNTYRLPEANRPGTYFRCIWDAGGDDILRYDGSRDAVLDLRPATLQGDFGGGGFVSHPSGIRGGFTIAAGVVIEDAIGGSGDDIIIGNAMRNRLAGRSGEDRLDGGRGADRMVGGQGDDVYSVESAGDIVVEERDEGDDSVRSTVSYALSGKIERLILDSDRELSGTGNRLDNLLRGNDAANRLDGENGDDRLSGRNGDDRMDGGRGADRMAGGLGDDSYFVDMAEDAVTERRDAGIDTVTSTISYTLPGQVDHLILEGGRGLSGTGNRADNTIKGNGSANRLLGEDGDDILTGRDGDDRLDGGEGADRMFGGSGNDIYDVDDVSDRVVEKRDGGIDTVRSAVTATLGEAVEDLFLTGDAAIHGTGNNLSNDLRGNHGANRLDGGAGDDKLRGLLGADTLTGGTGADSFLFRSAREAGIGAGRDAISDCAPFEDLIDVAGIDASTVFAGDQEFVFIGAAAFSSATQELRYADGLVAGDVNGDGAADFEIGIANGALLTAQDFIL